MKMVTLINKEKISKKKQNKFSLDREFVSKLGNFLYSQKDIESVGMRISFRDGSILMFDKEEKEDNVKRRISEDDE